MKITYQLIGLSSMLLSGFAHAALTVNYNPKATVCDLKVLSIELGKEHAGAHIAVSADALPAWRLLQGQGVLQVQSDGTVEYVVPHDITTKHAFHLAMEDSQNNQVQFFQVSSSADKPYQASGKFENINAGWVISTAAGQTEKVFFNKASEATPIYVQYMAFDPLSQSCYLDTGVNEKLDLSLFIKHTNPYYFENSLESETLYLTHAPSDMYPDISKNASYPTRYSVQAVNGVGVIDVHYPDVGEIQLGVSLGNDFLGHYPMIFYPDRLQIESAMREDETFDWDDLDSNISKDKQAAFIAPAGSAFDMKVVALDASGHQMHSFGLERPLPTVDLKATLLAPQSGHLGELTHEGFEYEGKLSSDAVGLMLKNVRYHEVGHIQVSPVLTHYLGREVEVLGEEVALGRFIPHHFDLTLSSTPSFQSACYDEDDESQSYTFFRQPFYFESAPSLRVSAMSETGQPLQNYADFNEGRESYAKLPATLGYKSQSSPKFVFYNDNDQTRVPPVVQLKSEDAQVALHDPKISGTYDYNIDATALRFDYIDESMRGGNIPPFHASIGIELTLEDSDGVIPYQKNGLPFRYGLVRINQDTIDGENSEMSADNGISFTGSDWIRHGRLFAKNTVWPDAGPIEVPVYIEIFNGETFEAIDSSCQTFSEMIDTDNIVVYNQRLDDDADADILKEVSLSFLPDDQSKVTLTLSGSKGSGSFDVWLKMKNATWLMYDWPNDGNFDAKFNDSPSARINFGAQKDRDFLSWDEDF